MLLLDASHTSHTGARTGIQRVVRSLHAALAVQTEVAPVCFDPYLGSWRKLDATERRRLQASDATPASSRGAKWSLRRRLRSHFERLAGRTAILPPAEGVICPELFSPKVGARLEALFAATTGPRIAIFHDAIGLQLPELTPPGTVTRLPAYLRELLAFDAVAAVSDASASSLREYWAWLGVANVPAVRAIPLGLDPAPAMEDPPAGARPRVLCVATLEGRKNHVSLLAACEQLWTEGVDFELELVGMARADTAPEALAALRRLQAAGRPLHWAGAVTDAALHEAYRRCHFSVYPSLREGFGLPVLESLQHGRPCICSGDGALGESAREGGCRLLESPDAAGIATAMRELLQHPARQIELVRAARARRFRSWSDYATELLGWMKSLSLRR